MPNSKHQQLSEFIKFIHKKLRKEEKLLGTDIAWKNHCEDKESLKQYSKAMQELAVNHWDKNLKESKKVFSRISWIYAASDWYFANLAMYREKEINILKTYYQDEIDIPLTQFIYKTDNKLQVLDVGSCYNPLGQYDNLEVLPIDIAPANDEVLICDFLHVKIDNSTIISDKKVIQLEKNFFDIIVFSLLLEYLPNPKQRLDCCINAYNLLKPEGILVVITPDSNHVGSNSKIFKSWQYVLAKHGFIRVKYEKLPYMHCMVFRKAQFQIVAHRWAEVHESQKFYEKILIPQDFNVNLNNTNEEIVTTNVWNADTFLEDLDLSSY